MKKILVMLFLIVDILLIVCFISVYRDNKINNNILSDKLDGIRYEDKIIELDNQYNELVDDIYVIIGNDEREKISYDEIILKMDMEYDSLVTLNNELIDKKSNLLEQRNSLRNTYNKLLEEELRKTTYIIPSVPMINQYSLGYPTGCESAALTVLLRYWGLNINMSSVVNRLPKGKLPYYENNVRYGGNPYIEFVGTPSTYSSYGVYEKPIIQVANSFKSGVIDGTGLSLNQVLGIVKEGRPVIVWVSMNMAVPYISTSWIYKPTGEKISWMANEHALVVVGYNKNQVIVSDSLTGSIRYYNKGVFESRYNTYVREVEIC